MFIIDSHIHLGGCRVFNVNIEEGELLQALDGAGVQGAIVQPFPGAPDAVAVHNRIAALAAQKPGRIFGLASVNPHLAEDAFESEVRRCVKDLGFVGVKLHTIGHAVHPLTPDANRVFAIARELSIPVAIHTGPGVPFALPSLQIPLIKAYPDVPVVLDHAGWGIFCAEALVVAKEYPNVYLEPSWCNAEDIAWFVSELGPDRVMMGSDSLLNLPIELAKCRALGLDDAGLAKVLGGTAIEVFKLQVN